MVIYIIGIIALVALNVILSPDEPNWLFILILIAWIIFVPMIGA